MSASDLKRAAALAALELVTSGSVIGLGSGSTAQAFVLALAERLRDGTLTGVRGVPTSRDTERLAREQGIELVDLPADGVQLAVDGMDRVDPDLNAIKGLGGALTREKIVAAAARRFVLIGDDSKQVTRLGADDCPLPVEVLGFGLDHTAAALAELGLDPKVRGGPREPFLSDNGHPVLDCTLPENADIAALATALQAQPGVVEHGFFLGLADSAFLAAAGGVRELSRPARRTAP